MLFAEAMEISKSDKWLINKVVLDLDAEEDHLAGELINDSVAKGKSLSTNVLAAGRLKKSKEFYYFMKNVVKAPKEVLLVYEEGYRPLWVRKPHNCRLIKNNKSAIRHKEFLWEEVERLVKLNCIEETKGPSSVMHPWSVVFSKKM